MHPTTHTTVARLRHAERLRHADAARLRHQLVAARRARRAVALTGAIRATLSPASSVPVQACCAV